jgi:peptidoglycan hydrolase-like protein with peptidoglycan-binding domain
VNNYYQSGAFDGYFSTTVANEIVAFRKFMILPDGSLSSASTYSGVADLRVIKGLLTSNGDTGRDSNTFDCATQLTDTSMIQRLY